MIDRRGHERIRTTLPVFVDAGDRWTSAVTEDVSTLGLKLRCAAPLAIGTNVTLRIPGGRQGHSLEASGTVVRCAASQTSRSLFEHVAGVRLLTPIPSDRMAER